MLTLVKIVFRSPGTRRLHCTSLYVTAGRVHAWQPRNRLGCQPEACVDQAMASTARAIWILAHFIYLLRANTREQHKHNKKAGNAKNSQDAKRRSDTPTAIDRIPSHYFIEIYVFTIVVAAAVLGKR